MPAWASRPATAPAAAPDAGWLGDIIAALQAAGALSALSPVPAHDHRGAPVADGGAASAVALPDLDGITLAILGLHNCLGRTVVHMHASGPMNQVSYPVGSLYYWPVIWIRDSGGDWHATHALGSSSPNADGSALRMQVVPPLSRATTGIEVIATARTAQARATLPLRWD